MGERLYDWVVVGAGFAGCTVAERLAAAGKRVLVVERRNHVGGNAHDYHDAAGILVHAYGAHVFHTNSPQVWEYLSRFTAWRPYQHRVLACVDGGFVPVPINLDTLDFYNGDLVRARRRLYAEYTAKQWGADAEALDPAVLARVRVRADRDGRYFQDRYQAMPARGYAALFRRMLDHPNIRVLLQADYRLVAQQWDVADMVYTGPVDEYFDRADGALPYRSAEFRFETLACEEAQPVGVVNYPADYDYTRVAEFKHLTGQRHEWTTLAYEYPRASGEPYWPVPTPASAALYRRYAARAAAVAPRVRFLGRLGTYRYYNMDQVVAQALKLAAAVLAEEQRCPT